MNASIYYLSLLGQVVIVPLDIILDRTFAMNMKLGRVTSQ